MTRIACLLLLCWMPVLPALALEWHSAERPPAVIELFTSEGCSSCPPADRWLSGFKNHPGLFSEVIPMAFHVGYWDWIGWEDRFAQPGFSARQTAYVQAGVLSQRYTPGIMVNSQEFRQWFSGQRQVSAPLEARGRLSVSLDESYQLTARFGFEAETQPPLSLHIVYLGNGLTTEVKDGENKGSTLHHDFVVLDHFHAEGEG